jgi:hypothetical protein
MCRINLWLEDIQIPLTINEGKHENHDPFSLSSFSSLMIPFRNAVAFLAGFNGSSMIQKYQQNFFPRSILSYAFVTEQKSMNDIVGSKKMENGIVVFFMEKNEKKYESFNYAELVDMKINALDLLERPKSYKVDVPGHKLIVQK